MGGQARVDTIAWLPVFDLTPAEYLMAQTIIGSWCTVSLRSRPEIARSFHERASGEVDAPEHRSLLVDAYQGAIDLPHERAEFVTHRHKRTFHSLISLALESNRVVALRCMKLMLGGRDAGREAERMVNEKIDAATNAGRSVAAGASADEIIRQYRRRVAANAKRLSGTKRTARRRK